MASWKRTCDTCRAYLPAWCPPHHLEMRITHAALPFVALLFAAACLVFAFRRLPLPYGLFALLSLLLPLVEPARGQPLYSYHRFVLVVFPLFMALASLLSRRRAILITWIVISCLLMLYLTSAAAIGAGGVE